MSASDGTALNGFDYIVGGGATQRFTILPDEQSLQFRFEILEDNILEEVESFYIWNAPLVEPQFETQGTITTTRINILDGTCELAPNMHV